MLGERKGPAGWLGESPHLSTAPRKKGADLSGLTGQDSRRSSPFQAFSPWENLFPSCMLLPAPKPFQKTFGDWPVKSGVFARMLRCARSTAGSARPPPSRASPAGKSARSNVFLQILVLSQDFRTTSDLLPSQANSTPLLRGAVLSPGLGDGGGVSPPRIRWGCARGALEKQRRGSLRRARPAPRGGQSAAPGAGRERGAARSATLSAWHRA